MAKRKTSDQLVEERDAIRSELLELDALEEPTEEQVTRSGELLAQFQTKDSEYQEQLRYEQQIQHVRSVASNPGNRESERSPQVMTRSSPYEDLDSVRTQPVADTELRSRALTAIERAPRHMNDTQRETATRLVESGDRHGRISRHMLLTGSDAYSRAFEAILTGVQPWALEGEEQEALRSASLYHRAINEGTDSAGGFLVPFHLDPTIILTNAGSTNPFRQLARTETISTNEWHGVSSAGVTAEWLSESTEAADASPSFSQPTVPVHKAAAYLEASFEATQDTNITGQVGMLLADAKDNLEAAAFATGSGSGRPTGVVTAVVNAGNTVATSSTGSYAVADVYSLKNAVPARHRSEAAWVANDDILTQTRQFGTADTYHAFWADLGMDTPPQLLGKSVHESSAMADSVAAGNNILLVGNFSRYLLVNRIGMTVQFEPLVKGANQRPTGQVGWFAHWRVGGNTTDPNAFRVLQVASA